VDKQSYAMALNSSLIVFVTLVGMMTICSVFVHCEGDAAVFEHEQSIGPIVRETITNNDLQFDQSIYYGELYENNRIGAEVMTVRARGGDDGQLTYSVYGDAAAWIAVEPTTGVVKARVMFDREYVDRLRFTVLARDAGQPQRTATAAVTITIVDVNDNTPTFLQTSYGFSLEEHVPVGTLVGSVAATDYDSSINGQVTYRIFGLGTYPFSIDAWTGALTTTHPLDREEMAQYELTVLARDAGQPQRTATAAITITIVDVNDNPPMFLQTSYRFSLEENVPVGTLVGSVAATDYDSSINGQVTYRIFGLGTYAFRIDARTGALTTTRPLDREEMAQYELRVVASDGGVPSRASTATVTVDVRDVNDNIPVFVFPTETNHTVHVSACAPVGHVITYLRAHDADEGMHSELKYSLAESEYFDVDEDLGAVFVNRELDHVDGQTFRLMVVVRDTPLSHSTSAILHITVD